MTIIYTKGDIFLADAQAIVNPVNCVGIMGKGLALQFKNKFPDNFKAYVEACKIPHKVETGHLFVFDTGTTNNPRHIINFPTKKHWRDPSKLEYLEVGLMDLVRVICQRQLMSVALPPLGCGLGGLAWSDVGPLITKHLEEVPYVTVYVFEP